MRRWLALLLALLLARRLARPVLAMERATRAIAKGDFSVRVPVDSSDEIGRLAQVARAGKTAPGEMTGGTFSITNVGVFGVDAGTPILNPGEAAILAFGAVNRRPWVVTGADGSESIEPRWVTTLALSFDHRLVDGELGSRYLADVAALLRDPSRGLVWG